MTLLFICSVVSNSLQHHVLQHTRLPWPSLPPGVCSHSCPLSQWCHPTMSSSPPAHLSCPKYFPASGSFLMSQFFTSGGQSFWAWASVLPMNIQGWFPWGLTGWISLLSKALSRVFQGTFKSLLYYHSLKASVLQCPAFFMVKLSDLYMSMEANKLDPLCFAKGNSMPP